MPVDYPCMSWNQLADDRQWKKEEEKSKEVFNPNVTEYPAALKKGFQYKTPFAKGPNNNMILWSDRIRVKSNGAMAPKRVRVAPYSCIPFHGGVALVYYSAFFVFSVVHA